MENIQVVSVQMVKDRTFMYGLKKINSPYDVFDMFRKFIGVSDREMFVMAALDTKNNVNALHVVSIGTLNASLIHPREVFKMAILSNAASIIVGHNHPSGDPCPSPEDIDVTQKLVEAGKLLDIPVLDHVIIGEDQYCSLKEKGFL